MRIALLSTPFIRLPPQGYGGTELFCWELGQALHARGHTVTTFATGDSQVGGKLRSLYPRGQWPLTAADEVNHSAWAVRELGRHVEDFDVVHSNSVLGLPLTTWLGLPVVHTLHHPRDEGASRIYATRPEVHYSLISQRQLELEVPLPRRRVIHHGLDPRRYSPSDRDAGYLLHLGRYAEAKGTHLAIDIATLAGLELRLAGRVHPGDEPYFEELVAPRLGGTRVRELGEAGFEAKLELLRGARALLCPLQWEEPFGLIAIEAMLCGTPVLGFARGSFPELIERGRTGYLASPGDLHALASRARRLETFDRRACAARARERFSAEAMASAYERLYADAIEEAEREALRPFKERGPSSSRGGLPRSGSGWA